MSGLFAMFAKKGALSLEAFERGTQRLEHRGAGARSRWSSTTRDVALGLTHEPCPGDPAREIARAHSFPVVFDGSLYGTAPLRAEVESRGLPAVSGGDDELIARLYEIEGVRCLDRLRGEFAFILWDPKNQLLLAARDRVGGRALHFAEIGDVVYVGSEAKALFAAGVPAEWDRESFFQATFVFYDADRSLFRNVLQVPPGHYLLATRYRAQLVSYWDYDYPLADPASAPVEAEVVQSIRSTLTEAVRLRMPQEERTACFLSGGIDSCTVLGIAASMSPRPVGAFTASFATAADYDEGARAEEMANHVRADFHKVPIDDTLLADNFFDMIWHSESLIHTLSPVANFLLAKAMRASGFRVALSGHGSDEIFAGYPHFRRDMLLYNSAGQDPDAVRKLLAQLEASNQIAQGLTLPTGAPQRTGANDLGFVPSWIQTRFENGARYRQFFSGEFAGEFADRDPIRVFYSRMDVRGQLAGREPVNQSQYTWNRVMLPNNQLTIFGDRAEMAHGIEGRLPYLDHVLIERVRPVPVRLKIRGANEKYVLREAARPYVTDAVYRREKHGFIAPPSSVDLGGKLHQLIQDTMRGPVLRAMPFFDSKAITAALDRLPQADEKERRAVSVNMTMILSACALHARLSLAGR